MGRIWFLLCKSKTDNSNMHSKSFNPFHLNRSWKELKKELEKEQDEDLGKYEAEYSSYMIKKYFSDKTIDGENVFEEEVKIGDQIIKSSRFPVMQSYIDGGSASREHGKAPSTAPPPTAPSTAPSTTAPPPPTEETLPISRKSKKGPPRRAV